MIAASAMDLDQLSRHFVSDLAFSRSGTAGRCSLPNILRGFNTTTGCDCLQRISNVRNGLDHSSIAPVPPA